MNGLKAHGKKIIRLLLHPIVLNLGSYMETRNAHKNEVIKSTIKQKRKRKTHNNRNKIKKEKTKKKQKQNTKPKHLLWHAEGIRSLIPIICFIFHLEGELY